MNATERGLNPFRPMNKVGAYKEMNAADPYDPRAVGLNGDTLDAMMKARWQEGYNTGKHDGVNATRRRFPDIYDEAFAAGESTGSSEEGARLGSLYLPLLQQIGATLAGISEQTSSKAIKETCASEVERIRTVLEREVGRYAEQSAATAGTQAPVQ